MNRLAPLVLLFATVALAAEDKPADPSAARQTGLSLTITLDKVTYAKADDIKLAFVLKNETGKDLFIGDGYLGPAYTEVGPSRHFELHLSDGKDSFYFWSGTLTEGHTSGIRKVFRLKPGETYKGNIVLKRLTTKPGEDRGGSFENRTTRKQHVLGVDGSKYTVALLYRVTENHGVWEPPADFRQELLWTGEILSKSLAFEVSDR
jgi:hypothetical protein